jgi:glyoxylase-like metal-dependent hydrolase (beta-lactamase superfamily II)
VLKSTIGLVVLLLCGASAYSQDAQRGKISGIREIIPGHYIFSSGDLNSGIIATSEGVVVFDALDSEAVGRAEREAIATTIRQPVRFLVSSPYHTPYSKGNIAYADVWKIGTEFYRTDLIRQMERDKASAEEQKARLPNQTFRDRVTLYLGGKEIQVLYLGRAHTRGDSLIYVPQDRIVYLSEIFSPDQFLFMNDGYGVDWVKTVDAAASLDADIFVPGHKPLPADPKQSRAEFLRYRQMLVDVRDAVQQAVTRGATEDQAVATIQWPQYEKLRGYDSQRPVVIRRIYRQLTGALQ